MDTHRQIPSLYIALVSTDEDHLRQDKTMVDQLNPKHVATFTDGGKALELLAKEPVQLIICDTELGTMDGYNFIRAIRQTEQHAKTPVIIVTENNTRQAVLEAINTGCTGYVIRPYAASTFQRHILMAQQLRRFSEIEEEQLKNAAEMVEQGNFDEAIEEFEEVLSMQDEAQKYYDMGYGFLEKEKYGKAIIAFNKALKLNDLFAEAYLGLAQAYKGKGNTEQYKIQLQKAAETHAQFDRMEKTKEIFIEIIKEDKHAPNPYNTLGVRLRRIGDYPGAVHAYERALELTPEDENIHYNLAKAYYFMGKYAKATEQVSRALRCNSGFQEANDFYKELTGTPWAGPTCKRKVKAGMPRLLRDH